MDKTCIIRYIKKDKLYLSFFISLVSVIISMYIFFSPNKIEGYENLFLLPLSFSILNMFFFTVYAKLNNIGVLAIMSLEIIRMVITPLVICLGNYKTAMPYSVNKNISFAIFLMVYELLVVFIVLTISNKINQTGNKIKKKKIIKGSLLKKIIIVMLIFLIGVMLIYPNSTTTFKTIFELQTDTFTTWAGTGANRYSVGSFERIITTLFTMMFTWMRYLLPTYFIIIIRKKFGKQLLGLIFTCFIICLQMLFITATIMESILCAFVLFIVLTKCYPERRRVLIKLALFLLVFLIVIYFLSRFMVRFGSKGNMLEFISDNINAYVGGVANVAGMIDIDSQYKNSTLFYNVYGAIPFNNTLFGLSGDKLSAIFNMTVGTRDGQIPTTIGASWYYFGTFLAPLESAIYTRFSLKYGNKALNERNVWKFMTYVLVTLMMAMGFTTYNSAIVLNYITTLIIPLLLLSKYTDDNEFDYTKKE